MQSLVLRSAVPADREVWLNLRSALWPGNEKDHADEIELHFERGDSRWPQEAWIAEVDGLVAGLAEVSVRPYAEGCGTREVGYLEGWYVIPEQRGNGVGRALIESAEDWARAQGCQEMASDTDPQNEASRRAHGACGFEDVGLVRCFRKRLA